MVPITHLMFPVVINRYRVKGRFPPPSLLALPVPCSCQPRADSRNASSIPKTIPDVSVIKSLLFPLPLLT